MSDVAQHVKQSSQSYSIDHATRVDLALAYRILAYLHLDDLTYTHITSRLPDEQAFFIFPFGMLYEEVTASSLLKVDFQGNILEGSQSDYNPTAAVIHAAVYQARSDVMAVIHTHSKESIAVSADPRGLMPLSQFALHAYPHVAYHDYDSLVLDPIMQGDALARDLGDDQVMLMRNHGALTVGKTIQEALFFTYHLQRACEVQVLCGSDQNYIMPDEKTCIKANKDLLGFEANLGFRDWQAWKCLMDQKYSGYEL